MTTAIFRFFFYFSN
ncbi:pheST operon leader peptide PheM [Candidatus Symbiopectobacterium sp.]|nr:pheST operon leader peptide PheM [Candidatus Symbiopectobacterium sp.]